MTTGAAGKVRAAGMLLAFAGCLASASCSGDANSTAPSSSSQLALSVQAAPDKIPRDGSSRALIVIEALDANGSAARLVVLRADILVNGAPVELGTLSSRTAVTGDDGKAQITYTAPPPAADATGTSPVVTISVTASGGGLRPDVSRQVAITLLPQGSSTPSAATPVPVFAVPQSVIVARTPVTFDASGTTSGGVRCTSCGFAWTFGDNTTASGETVTHAFSAPGSYQVTLTVTGAGGASASTSRSVAVQSSAKPTADFTFSPANPTTGLDILFNAERATAAAGRRIVSYDWAFGNGRTGSGLTIFARYDAPATYIVTLTVTDDGGESSVTDKPVIVSAPLAPTAVLSFSPATPTISATVFFDASASTAPSPATITSYTFNWGDGTGDGPSASSRLTHSYAATGTYVVRLTVTDSLGRSGTTTVSVPVVAVSPVAVLTFSPQDPRVGTTVFFDGTGSTAPAPATIALYALNYGDGTADGPSPPPRQTHVFAAAATYVVRLTVTDTAGRSATTTVNVTVR
jgi:PKD repeat protein